MQLSIAAIHPYPVSAAARRAVIRGKMLPMSTSPSLHILHIAPMRQIRAHQAIRQLLVAAESPNVLHAHLGDESRCRVGHTAGAAAAASILQ